MITEVHLPRSGISAELVQIEGQRDRTNVLILLFGFMGASFRQMARYVKLYAELHKESKNVALLTVIAPIQFTMTALVAKDPAQNGYGALSSDLASLVDKEYSDYQLIMHIMSQNGTFAYQAACKERVLSSRLTCVVLDSAPVAMSYGAVFSAASAAIGKGMAERAIGLLKYILSANGDFESYLTSRTADVKDFFAREDPVRRALFLYSKADAITDYRYIQDIIRIRSGSEVHEVDFGDSGHTGHILRFPRKYREEVLKHCCRALSLREGVVLGPNTELSKL